MPKIKYPELFDKKWLLQKYKLERLSSVEIGKILGCKASQVLKAFNKFSISTRNCSKAAKNRKRGFKSEKLRDKRWLKKKYVDDKLNTYEIAKLAGTNQHSVMEALKKHKIKTRTNSEAKKLSLQKNPAISKYNELNDRNWLYQKYIKEKTPTTKIAEILGCNNNLVANALRKYKIKLRTNKEAREHVEYKSHLYAKLNDKDWLEEQYISKKSSINKISDFIGVKTSNSVRQSLIRNDIDVRSISDGLTCNRVEDCFILDMPVIEGCLLGDASLSTFNKKSELSYPYFHKVNKYLDHIEFVAKLLFNKNYENRIFSSWDKRYQVEYYRLSSLCHKELKPIYKDWYPESNNYKKLVPKNIKLTPETLLHWFLDDGYSCFRKLKTKTIVNVGFCSQSFSKNDNEWLQGQMKRIFGLKMGLRKVNNGTGWMLNIWSESVPNFFDIIGPPPVASLAYKWKNSPKIEKKL